MPDLPKMPEPSALIPLAIPFLLLTLLTHLSNLYHTWSWTLYFMFLCAEAKDRLVPNGYTYSDPHPHRYYHIAYRPDNPFTLTDHTRGMLAQQYTRIRDVLPDHVKWRPWYLTWRLKMWIGVEWLKAGVVHYFLCRLGRGGVAGSCREGIKTKMWSGQEWLFAGMLIVWWGVSVFGGWNVRTTEKREFERKCGLKLSCLTFDGRVDFEGEDFEIEYLPGQGPEGVEGE